MSQIRVLLADDHEILRKSLAALLNSKPDLEIVGQAGDGCEAVELTHKLLPDVVVMDVEMPKLNGIEATQRISDELPNIPVIGLSMHANRKTAEMMKSAGAVTHVSKSDPLDVLLSAIRRIAGGRAFLG